MTEGAVEQADLTSEWNKERIGANIEQDYDYKRPKQAIWSWERFWKYGLRQC